MKFKIEVSTVETVPEEFSTPEAYRQNVAYTITYGEDVFDAMEWTKKFIKNELPNHSITGISINQH